MAESETRSVDQRENLIAKAAEFLQHPKVQSSTLAQRREFLLKKGKHITRTRSTALTVTF